MAAAGAILTADFICREYKIGYLCCKVQCIGVNMNIEEKIKRINELYHKSQADGLTEEEKDRKSVV